MDLLKENDAPINIDFLSIDTEGSEFEILKNFDFDSYKIKLICFEHNHDEVKKNNLNNLLLSNGYKEVLIDTNSLDSFYLLNDL
jgi:cellulose biosynthesis protein BcsQ